MKQGLNNGNKCQKSKKCDMRIVTDKGNWNSVKALLIEKNGYHDRTKKILRRYMEYKKIISLHDNICASAVFPVDSENMISSIDKSIDRIVSKSDG